jgi:glycine oxidase
VFDPAPGPQAPATGLLTHGSAHAAGFTAAGMLSPIAELDNAGPAIARLGWRSLALWRGIAAQLRAAGCTAPLFAQHGSLLLAHGSDLGAARRVLARLDAGPGPPNCRRRKRWTAALACWSPPWRRACMPGCCPSEAQVMSRDMLTALAVHAPNVHWCWNDPRVDRVEPGRITLADGDRCRSTWPSTCAASGPARRGRSLRSL